MVGSGGWWGLKEKRCCVGAPRARGSQGYVGKGCGRGDFNKQLRDCSPSFTGLEGLDTTDGHTARAKQNENISTHWAQHTLRIQSSYCQCWREGHLSLIEMRISSEWPIHKQSLCLYKRPVGTQRPSQELNNSLSGVCFSLSPYIFSSVLKTVRAKPKAKTQRSLILDSSRLQMHSLLRMRSRLQMRSLLRTHSLLPAP